MVTKRKPTGFLVDARDEKILGAIIFFLSLVVVAYGYIPNNASLVLTGAAGALVGGCMYNHGFSRLRKVRGSNKGYTQMAMSYSISFEQGLGWGCLLLSCVTFLIFFFTGFSIEPTDADLASQHLSQILFPISVALFGIGITFLAHSRERKY